MKYHAAQFSLSIMARVFQVSKSGYYSYLRTITKVNKSVQLDLEVKTEFDRSKSRYGYRRIHETLKVRGIYKNCKTIQKSMQIQGIKATKRKKFVRTTDSLHKLPVYPNILNRDFYAERPNQKWVGDTTYLRVGNDFVYLAVLLDLYNRKVVGWQLSDKNDSKLVCLTLKDALFRQNYPKEVIVHTDRGSTYCSLENRALIEMNNLIGSMSRKGNCWDNAVAESFFSTYRREIEGGDEFISKREAYERTFLFIEAWYNCQRLHSSIGYLAPQEKESIFV